ncbi:hypothetical protein AMK09_11480 [Streptomyces sp. CB02488]|uniref:PhnD/SsuA/transferrin family substrate-binding protein n=1 Tax=Streptomyces sp. CB02488 TaxID=1703920 RepID=UPI0009393EA5|nr:PhnD/SsuA/transferrin family substrate-binding protein [Streptomyces sp. CB02488]OKK23808.1 hypothetical protein AMK09_11480 [Streptomyces sp. CB02488]
MLLQTRRSASKVDLSFTPHYSNFTTESSINQALRSGSVDLALAGDNAAIFGRLQNNDTVIVGAFQRPRNFSQLVLAPGVRVDRLADLRGKRIACNPGSIAHLFILRTLAGAGVKPSEVTLIKIPGSGNSYFDAVRRGDVDVSPTNEPFTTALAREGKVKLLPAALTGRFNSGQEFLLASRRSLRDPAKAAAIASYVAAYVQQLQWQNSHPEQWARAYLVGVAGLKTSEALPLAREGVPYVFPRMNEKLVGQQQKNIDLLYDAKAIPERLDGTELFDLRFAPVIEAAVLRAGGSFADDSA